MWCALRAFRLGPRLPAGLGLAVGALSAAVPAAAQDASAIPAQFIAKMYTEALGRAPDQQGWSAFVGFFQNNGCGAAQLSRAGEQFYLSREFALDYGDNESRVLTLYRGILNRDPDQGGFDYYVSQLNSGETWANVVQDFFASAEFNSDVPKICSTTAPDYGFGSQTPAMPAPGSTGFSGTESALQALLNGAARGSTVALAQRAVITLSTTLDVPSGVRLATYGDPSPTSYAAMARLVRGATFDGPNVMVESGAALTHVWIDGQRPVLGYHKVAGGAGDNANLVTNGGTGIAVIGNKLSDPQGGTNFFSVGAPCADETVRHNLVTAYSAMHAISGFSDGLTMACEGLDLEHNEIVDVTDVGIVLFATPGVTQHSRIAHNVIVSAGLSTNAAISADPSTGNPGGSSLDYTGTVFQGNLFWTGPYTSFDFGIEAGGRPFFLGPKDNSDGTGAAYLNNTTGGLSARMRAGIVVAGMLNVNIANDSRHPLNFVPVDFAPGTPAATCPEGQVIVEAATFHASGSYPAPSFNGNFDNCVNGPFGPVPTNEIQVTTSPLGFDAATQIFNGTVTTTNVSSFTLVGPFSIIFAKLSAGATLVNATAPVGNTFFLAYPGVTILAPGQSATVQVEFTTSSNAPISFDPVIFAGMP